MSDNGPGITEISKNDISVIMPPRNGDKPERRQSMQGFDEEYVDIVDYIVRCTHRIWEERGIGLIYTHYTHNPIVHGSLGTTYTRDDVVASTVYGLQAFPDLRAYASDVVWSGNDVDGFYSSHRIQGIRTNLGYTRYGPPTGRRIASRSFADCAVKENRIYEEWLVRDESFAVKQLGFDVKEVVAKLAASGPPPGVRPDSIPSTEQVQGQTTPEVMPPKTTVAFDVEDFVKRTWHEVWNWRLLNRVHALFTPNFQCHTAGGRELYSREAYIQFILAFLSQFPDGRLLIDHFCALGDEAQGYRVALRWTFIGTHLYPGIYGEPTGKRVRVMGITHQHLKNGKFVEEWTIFDEIALLVQLATPTSSPL